MVICDNCGHDNKKTAKFCHSCGAKIEDIEIKPKPTHDVDLGKLSLGNIFSKKQPEPEFPTSFSYRGMNRYKSEGTTLALSLFIGLLGVMGVGHRYVGNVKRSLVILGIGESLFKKFNFWRDVAGDPTLTDGIRRAMQDYIRQTKAENPQISFDDEKDI